jgi:hypothetical protein
MATPASIAPHEFCPCGLGSTVRDFGAGWLHEGAGSNGIPRLSHIQIQLTEQSRRHSMSNLPAHKIKLGLTTATIWKNDGSYSVDITRSYKNGDGDWKNTSGFFHSDLLNIAKCAERAEIWISRQLSTQQ